MKLDNDGVEAIMSDNDSLLNDSFEKSYLLSESTKILEEEDNSPPVFDNDAYSTKDINDESTDDGSLDNYIDVSFSPAKDKEKDVWFYSGDRRCKIIHLDNLENLHVVPILMNCRRENAEMISTAVPSRIQENGTFIIDLDTLLN